MSDDPVIPENEATPSAPVWTPAGFPLPAFDPRVQAKHLYWQGWKLVDIARFTGIAEATIRSWKAREEWDKAQPIDRVEGALEARMVQLIVKGEKTGGDFKEIDLLGRQVERMARVRRYGQPGGHEGDLNPNVEKRNAGQKKKPGRNQLTAAMVELLRADYFAKKLEYQLDWHNAGLANRTRVYLKSRQIGATFDFAREALLDACDTGRNEIFLSASKNQAHVFRAYILAWVKEICDVELTGDPIVLEILDEAGEGRWAEQPTLYFLGTNARTAQSYHGNFYFDEFFWVYGFTNLNKVASGMAMHKKWRKTYFSTPSTTTHEAFGFWSGEAWNRKRAKADKRTFDTSWNALHGGAKGPDGIWRQIVTIEDAMRRGADFFDIEELRGEYSAEDFDNLLMCGFVDDTMSVFPLSDLQACMVDAMEEWEDFSFPAMVLGLRPFGDAPVWIGYDPSNTGDAAALVVVAPPAIPGGRFRILERVMFKGNRYDEQAAAIERFTRKYNVEKIDIDNTGIGSAVHQLVVNFFPRARALNYSAELKTQMVLKAMDVVRKKRLAYDRGAIDITRSFMAIRRALTSSGRSMTYEAGRSEEVSHADVAWATMQTLINEPLDAAQEGGGGRRNIVEIFE